MAAEETRLTTSPTPPGAVPAPLTNAQLAMILQNREARTWRRLDLFLVGLTLLLAFALASTAIRNSDFLFHLATGRLIAQGDYQFGVDPFSHTTEGQTWVNPSWLFDLLLYLLYQAMGGVGLVVLKGVATVAMAVILLRLSRSGDSLWWPILTTVLALLATAPRLSLFQPFMVSYLFLPLTLLILQWRGGWLNGSREPVQPLKLTTYWPLWPLFVLWANLDEWFLLGPITVALYTLGQWLQQQRSTGQPRPGEIKALTVATIGGFAVCLLNPHHILAFLPPPALGWFAAREEMQGDSLLRSLYLSPLQEEYFRPGYGLSVTGLAFFPLALLGLFSFALNWKQIRFWRALLFGAFLLLSVYHVRAVPFFALLAGPITALNLRDHVAVRFPSGSVLKGQFRRWLLAGRLLTVLLVLVLLGLTWPGWLHGQPYGAKRLAWGTDFDPTIEKAAAHLNQLHEQGVLGTQSRGFNYSPESANYLAWYCPQEKGFFDHRYRLQAAAAGDYVDVRKALQQVETLGPDGKPTRSGSTRDWNAVLRQRKVTHVVLYAADPLLLGTQLSKFASRPEQWVLLHADGHTAVYALKSALPKAEQAAYDLEREALRPERERWADPRGPEGVAESPTPWDDYLEPPSRRDPNTDEATMLLLLFEAEMAKRRQQRSIEGAACLEAGVALNLATLGSTLTDGGGGPFAVASLQRLTTALAAPAVLHRYAMEAPRGPEWYPLLAVRAARRALKNDLQDAQAHFALGNAYLKLHLATRENQYHFDGVVTPGGRTYNANLLAQLRSVQIMAALNQALLLKPDFEMAHGALAEIYESIPIPYVDLATKHRKEELRLAKETGRLSGETVDQYKQRIDAMEKRLEQRQRALQQATDEYDINSTTFRDDQERIQRAYRLGLASKALGIMKSSASPEKFGPNESNLYLQLLLETGQLKELAEGFEGTLERSVGKQSFQRYRMLIAATRGHYDEADAALADLSRAVLDDVRLVPRSSRELTAEEKAQWAVRDPLTLALKLQKLQIDPDSYVAGAVAQLLIESNPQPHSILWRFLDAMRSLQRRDAADTYAGAAREASEIAVIRGLLRLEVGDGEAAKRHFQAATDPNRRGGALGWNSDWNASGHRLHLYARDFLKRMD